MPTDGIAVLLIKTSGDFGMISVFRAPAWHVGVPMADDAP
jgi:hypothetical protein